MRRVLILATLAALLAPPVMAADGAEATDATRGIDRHQSDAALARMQHQVNRLRDAQDPQARGKLIAEHMQTMRTMMHAGSRLGMMGPQGGGMMGGSGDMPSQCMEMMKQHPDANRESR